MATAVNIVLNDSTTPTAVAVTFVPEGFDSNKVFWFVDQSRANAIGYWRISVERKAPPAPKPGESSANRVYRVRVGLHEPVLETLSSSTLNGITAAPTIAYIPRAFQEYILPERSTKKNRSDLRAMTGGLAYSATMASLVDDLMSLNN